MPVWPFSRKGRAPKLKDGGPTAAVASGKRPVAPYARPSAGNMSDTRAPRRRSSRRKRRTSSSSSISMPDADKIDVDIKPPPRLDPEKQHSFPLGSAENITALPFMKQLETSPHLRAIDHDPRIPYNFQSYSYSSLPTARERGKLQRPPTLRKRSAHDSALLPRRKSSKKRKNDHVREEEIRAMSMPLPQKRPARESGGLLRRESKKMKGGLNHRFERPTSEVSLPLQESIHSSMSGSSGSRAFRVSALDMFSPRPKIRYSGGSSNYQPNSQTASRSNSRKDRQALKDKDVNIGDSEKLEATRSKRMEELADTLDAGALREILERDKRRREKKKRIEEERLRRRLERRAEKQRTADQNDPTGTPALPRGSAQGTVGLGIQRHPTGPMEDVRHENPFEDQHAAVPQEEVTAEQASPSIATPMDSPVEEPVVADAKHIRYSRGSLRSPPTSPVHQHARGPSNVSHLPELLSEMAARESIEPTQQESLPEPVPAYPVESSRPTESIGSSTTSAKAGRRRSSAGRGISKWASFLRRGKRRSSDQGRVAASSEISFSNTSRESMSRQPLPAHLVAQPVQARRPSGTQYRGKSKFREDLPELPLSPPDSRVQSPEASSAIAAQQRNQLLSDIQADPNAPSGSPEDNEGRAGYRTDSPVSPSLPTGGVMSQSMASVDSEGSWLSGKPVKRQSNRSYLRSSIGSIGAKPHEEFNASYEELGIPDDEYFKRLTPQPDDRRLSARSGDLFARKASSTAMAAMSTAAESDTEDELRSNPASERPLEEVVHNVGRQPTVVHRQPRIKSAEGLLSYFQADEQSHEESSPSNLGEASEPEERNSQEAATVQRAKSIDLGRGHVRHLSAGSARLLDIPAKRASTPTSRSRTPTQQD